MVAYSLFNIKPVSVALFGAEATVVWWWVGLLGVISYKVGHQVGIWYQTSCVLDKMSHCAQCFVDISCVPLNFADLRCASGKW